MFDKSQSEFLLRKLQRNEVVLFVGAGFSLDAINKTNQKLPTGRVFAEKLWTFLGMPGAYDGTTLQTMYELLINKGIKHPEIKELLESTFLVKSFPDYYNNFSLPFWHKIYTTNIDNLLEKIYYKSKQTFKILKYPKDEYQEVDKSLETIQFVYLNGKLPCDPNELIFSPKQYATNSNSLQPLYHQFVNDYATTTTIFLGTSIDEPIFEQYIAARETRNSHLSEHRPQSFLIDPFISPARESVLKSLYNIECIKATTLEFSNWLQDNSGYFLDRQETLKITFPSLADLYTHSSERTINEYGQYFNEFSSGFKKVNLFGVAKSKNKNFLLGTSPSWNDIYNNLDASRKITTQIFDAVEDSILNEPSTIKLFTLLGSAGCGKSTILKRLSLRLSQNGRTVFFSYSEYIPDYNSIVQTINSLKQSVVLVFDNADLMLLQLPKLIEALQKCNFPPKVIISTRTNVFDRLTSRLESIVSLVDFKTPNLDRDEIIEVINKLAENNLLGNLKGLSDLMRIKEFENRSKKQILVAMREVTKGESFDNIIKSEYGDIVPSEAKFLTACIALTTEAGFTVTKQDFVGFSYATPAETLYFLERNLHDVIIKAGPKQDRLLLRHRTIADYIINNCLDGQTLKKVYLRILSSLAPEINIYDFKSRKFAMYREIINHYKVYKRFKSNINNARELYESLIPYFNLDFQFWLQYGSLELEGKGGSLELAQNYLLQAESLRPKSVYVKNALANLYYKKSILTADKAESFSFREKGNDLMHEVLSDKSFDDAYTYHIYCKGNYNYVIEKIDNLDDMKKEFLNLKKVIQQGMDSHPLNKRLKQISQVINKAYLLTAVTGDYNFPSILTDFE
jgi:hypothetical protein